MTRLRGLLATLAGAVVVLTSGAPALSAHPLATTTVSVKASAGRIDVTIVADAEPLIAKLEALSSPPSQAAAASTREQRLSATRRTLLDHVALVVDGAPVGLEWRDATIDTQSTATVHLGARMPADASTISWEASFIYGSYPVSFHTGGSKNESVQWLQATERSAPVSLARATGFWLAARRALWMGVTHIVPEGLDHILFVLGLFFLSTRTRQVLLQVTAFTVAHSMTLGLALYGVISLRSSIVEPLIALSVAYVGIENLVTTELKWRRVALVFLFGLLHGMGFAEALSTLQLQRSQFLTTLVSFNLGVEAGQLLVIAAAAVVLLAVTRARENWRRPIARLASAGIGLAGFVWMIQRLAA